MSARYRSATLAVAWRSLHTLVHKPALLLPSLMFPLFFFTAFAGGLSAVDQAPGFGYHDYTAFQFAFVLTQAAAFGGVFTGFAMARDWESGFARRMMLAALRRSSLIAGYVLAGVVRTIFVTSMLFLVALAAGMDFRGGAGDLVALLGLALCVNVAATLFASGIALRFRTLQASPLMQVPVFLTLFVAPVYVPRDLLSGWVASAADYNPATALLEAARGFLAGTPTGVGLAFGVVAALVLAFSVWSLRGMRRAEAAG